MSDVHRTIEAVWKIESTRLIAAIARDIAGARDPGTVSRCFHNSIATMMNSVCSRLRERSGMNRVCLSGGTFQNMTLLHRAVAVLRHSGFEVFLHSRVPPNDGGISLGQAAIAAAHLSEGRS